MLFLRNLSNQKLALTTTLTMLMQIESGYGFKYVWHTSEL